MPSHSITLSASEGVTREDQPIVMAQRTRQGLSGGGKAIPAPNGSRSGLDDVPSSCLH